MEIPPNNTRYLVDFVIWWNLLFGGDNFACHFWARLLFGGNGTLSQILG